MIHAEFEKIHNHFCTVRISGHAGFADAGQDIVCAAVSSAVQYATLLITETFHEKEEESDKHGVAFFRLCHPEKGNGSKVIEGLYQHLQFISEDYPNTIEIIVTEV
ncbi:MAG: ribosomal-processing cysteine protease Prp [Oscillospiraceae bacterium]